MENPKEFIDTLKNIKNIRIYIDCDIAYICSASILVNILAKEYVKHEIVFLDDINEIDDTKRYIYFGKKSKVKNELISFSNYRCDCSKFEDLSPLVSMYKLAKSLNHINNSTLWPLIVYYMYFKDYLYSNTVDENEVSDEESLEFSCNNQNICEKCTKLYNEIFIEIKRYNSDGKSTIVVKNQFFIPLLEYSSLFDALKNDIFFISNNKLHIRQKGYEIRKIQELLASKGIPNSLASEKYKYISLSNKKVYTKSFGKRKMVFKEKDYSNNISAVDNTYLLFYYIIKKLPMKAFLCLNRTIKSLNTGNISTFFTHLMDIVKESVSKVSKFEDIYIFKVKNNRMFVNYDKRYLLYFIYLQIGVFVDVRLGIKKYLVIYDLKESNNICVYGEHIKVGPFKINGYLEAQKTAFYKVLLEKK